MESSASKELGDLLMIVRAWEADYLSFVQPGHEHLEGEFSRELNRHVMPYLRRMVTCGLVTQDEAGDFWGQCMDSVLAVREALEKVADADPPEEMRGAYE